MKCRECSACEKGWFKSKPDKYVCIGVPEPFVIEDINVECTQYEEKRNAEKRVSNEYVKKNVSKFFDDTLQGLLEAAAMKYKVMQGEGKSRYISDCLYIGVDFAPNDDGTLVVMRRKDDNTYVINQFRNDEALELYNKLIGVK